MQISHKLFALGLGGMLATAAVLVGVGAWQSGRFADTTQQKVLQRNAETLDRTTANVTTLVRSVGDEVQSGVDRGNHAASVLLTQRGGVRLSDRTVPWTAINQASQDKKTVTLPRLLVGDTWLGQNADLGTTTPYVDDARALAGVEVTMFQRMNDAGELIRVGTTVKSKAGKRAIGTEVAAGSREIAEGINVVSGAVNGTRKSISVSHQAADELIATARRLTDLVDRFTV